MFASTGPFSLGADRVTLGMRQSPRHTTTLPRLSHQQEKVVLPTMHEVASRCRAMVPVTSVDCCRSQRRR
jgi:hypothetical protein